MADLFNGGLTGFDVVIIAVIVISALMSLGRGLIREATSLISFVIGCIIAYYSQVLFTPSLEAIIPKGWPSPSFVAFCILVVVGFVAAYSVAAFIGARVSRLLHSAPEFGMLDRIAGAAFGAIRGALAIVLFVLLMEQVLPEEATPRFIADSRFFPYADASAGWLRENVPGFVDRAKDAVKAPVSGHTGASPRGDGI